MGIIIKQSIKGSIYSYIGAAIGFINTAILLPIFFTTAQIGLIFLLISISMIFAQIFGLGFNGVTTRLFPYFNDKSNKHNGFSSLMINTNIVGILIFVISYFFIRPIIIEQNSHSIEFINNIDLLIPIVIIEILFRMFNTYASVLLNSVIGVFYKEFILRLLISVLIVLFILKIIDFNMFLYMYITIQIVPVIAILINLIKNNNLSLKPKLDYINFDLKKSIIFTAIISSITGLSAMGYQFIDKYMINVMLDLSNTGVYTIAFFFGSMIGLPSRSLKRISSVIIAKAWKENDLMDIKNIYIKSSITQTVIGLFILLGIMINIDDVISILGNDYAGSKMVIFYIGVSFIIDLTFGVGHAIIGLSKYYKYLSLFMVIFLISVVYSNYLLIPEYGINGAALASAISMLLFSLIKYIFIIIKFKMQPFTLKHILMLIISIILFILFYYLPISINNPYFNIIIKSGIFTILFMAIIYKFKISIDINNQLDKLLSYITKNNQ